MAKKSNRAKKIQRIADRIVPIDDAPSHLKILVYGRNKQGKTRFAGTAPNPLFLDINEKGTKSVRGKGHRKLEINKWEDITYAYWFLKYGDHDYESVVIDTLTQMQHMCMRQVLGEALDADPNKDPALASKREWGKVAEMLKPLLLNFRNLDMHVIFLAQERTFENDEEMTEHVPDMSGAPRSVATGSVDVIGRIYLKENRAINKKTKKETKKWGARMLVGPHEAYTSGIRMPEGVEAPRILKNPTVDSIFQLVTQEED